MSMVSKSSVKPAVKHMVRQLARISNPAKGYITAEQADSEIGSWLLQGYRLVNTHYLGSQRDNELGLEYLGVMYIFQLEQSEIERMRKNFMSQLGEDNAEK